MARYPAAQWLPSPNTGGVMGTIRLGVLHVTEEAIGATESWFSELGSAVSSHFGIAKDGSVVQFVDTGTIADAEGIYNDVAISVDIEGNTGDSMTPAQVSAAAALAKWIHTNHSVPLGRTLSPAGSGWIGHCELGTGAGALMGCPGVEILTQWVTALEEAGATVTSNTPVILHGANIRPAAMPDLKEVTDKMHCIDPETGAVLVTTLTGQLYADPVPSDLTLKNLTDHSSWNPGSVTGGNQNPCLGVEPWRDPSGKWGYLFITQPSTGGIVGPYTLFHFGRDGTAH